MATKDKANTHVEGSLLVLSVPSPLDWIFPHSSVKLADYYAFYVAGFLLILTKTIGTPMHKTATMEKTR